VSRKTPDQKRARELQALTDASYTTCLRVVREHKGEGLDVVELARVAGLLPACGAGCAESPAGEEPGVA
jgi:hypothetical protein